MLAIADSAGGIAVSQVSVINFVSKLSVSLLNPLRERESFQVTVEVIITSMTFEIVQHSVMIQKAVNSLTLPISIG